MPVLIVLATMALIFIYPPVGAFIFPASCIVEAVIEDVWNWFVVMAFEKVAVLPLIDDMVIEPAGFTIAVELSRRVVACCA